MGLSSNLDVLCMAGFPNWEDYLMTEHNYVAREVLQPVLYFVTSITMLFTGYNHLDFAADGIENITSSDLVNAAPVIFLAIGAIALLFGALAALKMPNLAAKIGFTGGIIGLGYYTISMCALAVVFSPGIFLFPRGFLLFVVPGALLFYAVVYSRQIMKSVSKIATD